MISGKTLNNKIIGSQGLVLGYVYDKIYIDIPKEENILEPGDYQGYYQLCLFGKSFNISKNNNYDNSSIKSNNIFNIFDFFSIKKIEERQNNDIIKKYTREEAQLKAVELIKKDFNSNKIHELEKIVDLVEYNYEENETSYCFTFITKKIVSIGEFAHY